MFMSVEVRIATMDDLKTIQNLNKKLFDEEFEKYDKTINCNWPISDEGREFYEERITKDSGCAFVLIEDSKIIGYLVASLSEDEFYRCIDSFAELDDMYILEEYRSKGYGGLLYSRFIQWCYGKKVKRLKVLVTAKNKQAIKFYKRKGFDEYNVTLEKSL